MATLVPHVVTKKALDFRILFWPVSRKEENARRKRREIRPKGRIRLFSPDPTKRNQTLRDPGLHAARVADIEIVGP
jgi:hypothetical protein